MTVPITAQTLQVYRADTRDVNRKLSALNRKEKEHAVVVEKSAEKSSKAVVKSSKQKVKATKSVSNHFDILTMAIGGMSSEVGVAAETGKRLSEGFGALGVATMGVGLALGALAPHISTVISGFTDLFKATEKPQWTALEQNILSIGSALQVVAEEAKTTKLALSLLSPVQRTAAEQETAGNVVENRNVRALELLEKRGEATAELTRAEKIAAEARAEATRLQLARGENVLKQDHEITAAARAAEAAAIEAERVLSFARKAKTEADTAASLAGESLKQALIEQELAVRAHAAAAEQDAVATERAETRKRRAIKQTLDLQLSALPPGFLGGAGQAQFGQAGALQGLGAAGPIAGQGGPLASLTDPLGRIIPPEGAAREPSLIEKLFGKPQEIDAVAGSFNALAAGVNAAMDALSSGEGASAAWELFYKTVASSLSELMFSFAKAQIAHAAADFAVGNGWGVAAHSAAAALFLAAGAYAGSFAGTSTGGGGTGGFAPSTGGQATQTTTNTTINLGDSYIGLSNRRRKAELERLLRSGRQGGGGSYEG